MIWKGRLSMEQKITQTVLGKMKNGETAILFRIPNNTNDYIEVTNYGCIIKSICIHDRQGALRNILHSFETLEECQQAQSGLGMVIDNFSPTLTACLAHTAWNIKEIGENYVFFTCQVSETQSGLHTALIFGAKIMWVNLNRIVIDLFVAPERKALVSPSCHLAFHLTDEEPYMLRTFCPQFIADGQMVPTEETAYTNMTFLPLSEGTSTFFSPLEETKPMAELTSSAAGLTVSAYSDMDSLSVKPLPGNDASFSQFMLNGVHLKSGESFSARVIYGFDRLYTPDETEKSDFSPFSVFL